MKTIPNFSNVPKSNEFLDDRGRVMRFPTRRDYFRFLVDQGIVNDEKDILDDPRLIEAIYLDWLRRAQVGCVFAQLLGRPKNRMGMQTVVFRKSGNPQHISELARKIDEAVRAAINSHDIEAISILLPDVVAIEELVHLILVMSRFPQWNVEREQEWRGTTILVGLRVELAASVWAETLGLGPFQFFPPTRQGPITSIEIRTMPLRAKRNKFHPTRLASHLADIETDHFLTSKEHGVRSNKWTPILRTRILGGHSDRRAKAAVTFSFPAAIWKVSKFRHS